MDYKREFLKLLLEKKALKIAKDANSFFRLKSGRMSPHFVSIGALTDGESLSMLKRCYSHAAQVGVRNKTLKPFEYVFGPAYKGINLCALTCEGLYELGIGWNPCYLYDRKEEKTHGEVTQGNDASRVIVGAEKFVSGGSILLVDDVITTGQAKYEALEKIRLLGNSTLAGMVIAVDRQELMDDGSQLGSRSAVQALEEQLHIKTFPVLTMQEIYLFLKDSLSEQVRRAWMEYYEKFGAVRME